MGNERFAWRERVYWVSLSHLNKLQLDLAVYFNLYAVCIDDKWRYCDMRIFEVMIILAVLAATAGILFVPRKRRVDIGLLFSVVLVLVLHGGIEHFRIQMAPVYAVALGLLMVLILRVVKPGAKRAAKSRWSWVKTSLQLILVLVLSGSAAYLSLLLPVFTMPEPTGSYAVGTFSRQLTDESRKETLSADPNDKRELMVNVSGIQMKRFTIT
ncbi:hypothetical protein D3C76_188270 [compost metagenome]